MRKISDYSENKLNGLLLDLVISRSTRREIPSREKWASN